MASSNKSHNLNKTLLGKILICKRKTNPCDIPHLPFSSPLFLVKFVSQNQQNHSFITRNVSCIITPILNPNIVDYI